MKPKAINLMADLTPDLAQLPAVFTLIKPNGTVSKSVLTDLKGVARVQFSLGRKYVRGTYQGKVEIVVDGKKVTDSQSVVI